MIIFFWDQYNKIKINTYNYYYMGLSFKNFKQVNNLKKNHSNIK